MFRSPITYTRNKKSTGRKALPKSLPYIEKIHDLSNEEKQCACGCALTHIHDEITEQLDVLLGDRDYMIFIVCQRVILIYFRAKSEMVARLRGHDKFFCHVRREFEGNYSTKAFKMW